MNKSGWAKDGKLLRFQTWWDIREFFDLETIFEEKLKIVAGYHELRCKACGVFKYRIDVK